jgi:predicted HAD superfamily Cof-like phosphohydrolase
MQKGNRKHRELRLNLFLEEFREFTKATYENDKIEQLDGAIDQLYILFGSVHYHGLGTVFNDFVQGEAFNANTPVTEHIVNIDNILESFTKTYIYGNFTYSSLLLFHVELCGSVLSLIMKLELEGAFKQNSFATAFLEVHNSNMSKLDDNGNPIFRGDGKVLKSSNYFKPNLKQFINL